MKLEFARYYSFLRVGKTEITLFKYAQSLIERGSNTKFIGNLGKYTLVIESAT